MEYPKFIAPEFSHDNEAKEKLEAGLSALDFERFHAMLAGFAKQYGIDNPSLIGLENITPVTNSELHGAAAAFLPTENKILINVDQFADLEGEELELKILHALSHESTHALAAKECSPSKIFTGFHQMSDHDSFMYFNEAVTEKKARSLTSQYLETDARKKELRKALENPSTAFGYEKEVIFLNKLIELISSETGVSVEAVDHAITNDYLHGQDLFDEEIQHEFDKAFYEFAMTDISQMGLVFDPDDLIKRLKNKNKSLVQRIIDRFTKILKTDLEE